MKKIIFIIFSLAIVFPAGISFANSCSGTLDSTYTIPNGDYVYYPGEQVDTRLSFILTGDDEVITQGNPLSIVLTMDRSGSMSGILSDAKDALISVVERVRGFNNLENRLSLVTFSSSATIDQILTNDYDLVNSKINSFSASGMTSIGGSLVTSAQAINFDTSGESSRNIIIATDGYHNTGPTVEYGITSVPSDVTVYTIGIGGSVDSQSLEHIARTAGTGDGEYFSVSHISDLEGVLDGIVTTILEFEASNFELDFSRLDVNRLDYLRAVPSHSSITSLEKDIAWQLGNLRSGDGNSIDIAYEVLSSSSNPIVINEQTIEYSYDDVNGNRCTSSAITDVIEITTPCSPVISYTCDQGYPDCSNEICRTSLETSPTCYKTDSCSGASAVSLAECESNGVSCSKQSIVCSETCVEDGDWREVAP